MIYLFTEFILLLCIQSIHWRCMYLAHFTADNEMFWGTWLRKKVTLRGEVALGLVVPTNWANWWGRIGLILNPMNMFSHRFIHSRAWRHLWGYFVLSSIRLHNTVVPVPPTPLTDSHTHSTDIAYILYKYQRLCRCIYISRTLAFGDVTPLTCGAV